MMETRKMKKRVQLPAMVIMNSPLKVNWNCFVFIFKFRFIFDNCFSLFLSSFTYNVCLCRNKKLKWDSTCLFVYEIEKMWIWLKCLTQSEFMFCLKKRQTVEIKLTINDILNTLSFSLSLPPFHPSMFALNI